MTQSTTGVGKGAPGKSRPKARGPNPNKQKPRPWLRKSKTGQPRDQKITLTHTADFAARMALFQLPDESGRDLLDAIATPGLELLESLLAATSRKKTVESIAAAIEEQIPLLSAETVQQLAERIYQSRQ